jgi:hypothetical protein
MDYRNTTHPAACLLSRQQPTLTTWYGEPPQVAEVVELQARTREALQLNLCQEHAAFNLHVLQLACDYWSRRDAGSSYENLAAVAVDRRDRALLELVYGQLLMGCKLRPAGEHLARGFRLAVPWLSSAGYFELVRRHERLDCLRLTDMPAPPQGLERLLAEAAVVRHIQQGRRGRGPNEHRDTVG